MLQEYISDLKQIVGNEGWIDNRDVLLDVERTTFKTDQKIAGIVFPRNTEEVSRVISCCRSNKQQLYPISKGCNWGLGSKVPLRTGSVLCDLSKMNRIVEYNSELGWIRIQPGTTFAQVSDFLKVNGNKHFLSVTGGSPSSSILANTLERGDGLGPMGDRSHYTSDLEVVLGDGRILRTGFKAFDNESEIGSLTSDTLGPSLDGLFYQSNLGIVTEMTVWLQPTTEHFATILFTASDTVSLSTILNGMRSLLSFQIVKGNSSALWNMQKVLASNGAHPLGGRGSLNGAMTESEIAENLPPFFKGAYWFGTINVYGITAAHLRAQLREIRVLVKPASTKMLIVTRFRRNILSLLSLFSGEKKRREMNRWIEAFFDRSVYRGNTSELSIRSLYWRKSSGVPDAVDPNKDRCGLVWLCHAVPFSANAMTRAEEAVKRISHQHGLDPNVAFLFISERYVRMFVAFMFDRDVPGADQNAFECQRITQEQLLSLRFPAFRLGIQSMDTIVPSNKVYQQLISELKNLIDPSGVITPGRYDFCGESRNQ